MILCHRPPCDTTQGVSHDKEKKNAKGFPSCSWLPVTLNLGANCPSVVPPQFLRARLYGSVPAMSEDFTPKAYFLFFFRELPETASTWLSPAVW